MVVVQSLFLRRAFAVVPTHSTEATRLLRDGVVDLRKWSRREVCGGHMHGSAQGDTQLRNGLDAMVAKRRGGASEIKCNASSGLCYLWELPSQSKIPLLPRLHRGALWIELAPEPILAQPTTTRVSKTPCARPTHPRASTHACEKRMLERVQELAHARARTCAHGFRSPRRSTESVRARQRTIARAHQYPMHSKRSERARAGERARARVRERA